MSDNDTHQPDGVLHAEKSISDYLAEQVDAVSETRLRSEAGMLGSFRALISTVERVLPPSRERSLTITKLEEAEMWAGKGGDAMSDGPDAGTKTVTTRWWATRPADMDQTAIYLVRYESQDGVVVTQEYLDSYGAWNYYHDGDIIEPALRLSGRLLAGLHGAPDSLMENWAVKRLFEALAQRDGRVVVSTEWAAGLAEDDSDECPDCGFVLADDMSGGLERTPRAASQPCDSCLWAHGPFEFERTTADEVA